MADDQIQDFRPETRPAPQTLPVTLEDRYARFEGRVFLTGIQALVRLPLLQKRRDRAAGLNTAGFISGYRGSPLGGYDLALNSARKHLASHDINFVPGINEDLAATAVWGSQQVGLLPGAKYDGVFGLWYGKGPGVDRSGDVLKHASYAGTPKHGGAIALCGDDHGPHPFRHARSQPLYRRGTGELRALGLGHVALQRLLDRHEGVDRYGGRRCLHPSRHG